MVLVKLSGKTKVGCEMSKSMTKNFFSLLNTFPDEKENIRGVLAPGGKSRIPIDNKVLKGVKSLPISFLSSEGELIKDVVRELVIFADGLSDLLTEVDCFLQDGLDLGVKMLKTCFSLWILFLAVDEKDQHNVLLLLYCRVVNYRKVKEDPRKIRVLID